MRRLLAPLVVGALLSACGARTEIGTPNLDASPEASTTDSGATCMVTCGAGQVCIHRYGTHDPPPPLADGGVCTFGTERYDRCWYVTDRCETVPAGCVEMPSCSCPPFRFPEWPEGCECNGDGTFNCYSIGI